MSQVLFTKQNRYCKIYAVKRNRASERKMMWENDATHNERLQESRRKYYWTNEESDRQVWQETEM